MRLPSLTPRCLLRPVTVEEHHPGERDDGEQGDDEEHGSVAWYGWYGIAGLWLVDLFVLLQVES